MVLAAVLLLWHSTRMEFVFVIQHTPSPSRTDNASVAQDFNTARD